MRFVKILTLTLLISFIALITLLMISHNQRLAIINQFAKTQLADHQVEITCFNFHFQSDMSVIIDNLCLTHAKAHFEIKNANIQWSASSTPKVTSLDIDTIKITGVSPLFQGSPTTVKQNEKQNFNQVLSSALTSYIENVKQLPLSTNINIKHINYSPFLSKSNIFNNDKQTTSNAVESIKYQGSVKLLNNSLNVSLGDERDKKFLTAQLNIDKGHLIIEASSALTPLLRIVETHQFPLSSELYKTLNSSELSGKVNILIESKDSKVIIKNSLTDLKASISSSFTQKFNVNFSGSLNFHTKLDLTPSSNDAINITLFNENNLTLESDPVLLLSLLNDYNVSQEIISIIKDNPLSKFTLNTEPNTTLKISNVKTNLSSLEISAKDGSRDHYIKMKDITLNKAVSNAEADYQLQVNSFNFNSQLTAPKLKTFSKDYVSIQLIGSLTQTTQQTLIKIADESFVSLKNIVFPIEQKNSVPRTLASIKENKVTLKGTIVIEENNQLSINLAVNNNASQIVVPKKMELKNFTIDADIKGSLNAININAILSANNVELSNMNITGSIESPQFQFSGSKLQLTDLLTFNMKLPTEISLIDGVLDYNIEGKISDFITPLNNALTGNISVSSLSGEIDGIWLQELNWQQEVALTNGVLSTIKNNNNNLTIALIETGSPITNVTTGIDFSYNKTFEMTAKLLSADVLGGSFSIPQVKWPLTKGHSVDVQLTGIDLEQVLALDSKEGIVVTGHISGQLPILYDGKQFTVEDGKLYNINNGIIQVINNPAVAELKNNNSQLQLAFDALENLHYHQLSSTVSMADDGYMLLQTEIKGRNPDIDNDVNLNLNLTYDLPGLLESLSITDRFEQNIIDGLQNN
ncbi:intermembrane phospholipid transport protein YdbH family protein [Thalassotalea profundi]|uniref:Dicarboxylate transport domain-containing protein n=1 Tax=Thalassotalea profundi TaxID=2036687 RepID=A0ABQ3IH68_9GAMM|nr:YdbH domain-containing protein [Thalassotalea profundi]GHE82327.1 hypothetical protein GCM10011501_08120 [Thalassotalea profundi]